MRTYHKENGLKFLDIEIHEDGTGTIALEDKDVFEFGISFGVDDIKKFVKDLNAIVGLLDDSSEV